MNLQQKIAIDRSLGYACAVAVNICARSIGIFLKRKRPLAGKYQVIVVSKLIGMGSVIQSTPLLQTLRTQFPVAKLVYVTASSNRELVERTGLIDVVSEIDDTGYLSLISSYIRFVLTMLRLRVDWYIDLEVYSHLGGILALSSLARMRTGFFRYSHNYRFGIYTDMVFFNATAPISRVYLQMAGLGGASSMHSGLVAPRISEEERNESCRQLKRIGLDMTMPYIVVNPNASELRVERRWPVERYPLLFAEIKKRYPSLMIVLTGSAKEVPFVGSLMQTTGANANVIDASGRLNLSDLIALIDASTLMVTNDTGPMHLAFALKKKTVSLWGPVSPRQYGEDKRSYTIYKNAYCSPCTHDFLFPPCKGDNSCMKLIGVENVFEAVCAALEEKDTASAPPESEVIYNNIHGNEPLGIVHRNFFR